MGDGTDIEQVRTQFIENIKLGLDSPEKCQQHVNSLIDNPSSICGSDALAVNIITDRGMHLTDRHTTFGTQINWFFLDKMSVKNSTSDSLELTTTQDIPYVHLNYRYYGSSQIGKIFPTRIAINLKRTQKENGGREFLYPIPRSLITGDLDSAIQFIQNVSEIVIQKVHQHYTPEPYQPSDDQASQINENIFGDKIRFALIGLLEEYGCLS